MANNGYAWPLIEGTGVNYGVYVIESLNEDKDTFFRDGAAQKIGFELSLQRVDDNRRAGIGTLSPDDVSRLLSRSTRSLLR
jgi:phage protein U